MTRTVHKHDAAQSKPGGHGLFLTELFGVVSDRFHQAGHIFWGSVLGDSVAKIKHMAHARLMGAKALKGAGNLSLDMGGCPQKGCGV